MTFKTMFLNSAACLLLAATANAAQVSYVTQGMFHMNGTDTTMLDLGGGTTLSYENAVGTNVETESNITLGSFILNSTTGAAPLVLDNTTFDLRIIQTAPVEALEPGSDNIIMAVLSGTVRFNQSSGKVVFESSSVSFPDVRYPSAIYQLVSADFAEKWTVALVAPTSLTMGASVSTIQGRVIGGQGAPPAAIPEPSTYALLGSGLLGMGLVYRRRRSAR